MKGTIIVLLFIYHTKARETLVFLYACVAQLVEHLVEAQGVGSASLSASTIYVGLTWKVQGLFAKQCVPKVCRASRQTYANQRQNSYKMFRGQNLVKKCFGVSRPADKVKKGYTMFLEEDEDFDLIGKTDDEEEEVQETTDDAPVEETAEEEKEEEVVEEKPDEEEPKPKRDNKTQALDSERARRKQAEKELKELRAKLEAEQNAKEDGEKIQKEREAYKQKMLEGDLIDGETAEKLLDVFGEDIIKGKIANERRAEQDKLEQEIQELKKDDLFLDADVYKPQIKELMKKGLTAKQAYMASLSEGRLSQLKRDLEIEAEQRFLNRNDKADKVDVGVAEAKGEVKRGTYSKREQEIAKETGLPVAEVHKRSKMFSIEDFENL